MVIIKRQEKITKWIGNIYVIQFQKYNKKLLKHLEKLFLNQKKNKILLKN